MTTFILHNEDETKALGQKIGQVVEEGTIIVLSGELGTGKTTLSKGIAQGLGIKQMIKSPTYTLIREYEEGRMPLYHMDVYRLEGCEDDLGFDEYFLGDGLCLIEWGSLIESQLPPHYYEISLSYNQNQTRQCVIIEHGKRG